MIIFVPIRLSATGGTSTFARKFQQGMQQRGHHVVFKQPARYDALLILASCSPRFVWHALWRRIPIIQRLDGVYYPQSVAGARYRWHNLPLRFIYRYAAKAVIFQSRYSAYCARMFLGGTPPAIHQVIYNGVDVAHFSPRRQRPANHPPTFVTWSRFRRADQIEPLLAAFNLYREQYNNQARLLIAGDFIGKVRHVPQQLKKMPHVSYEGTIPNENLPALAHRADIFLFTHQNPPCPNNVLEALACGLPICGVADGAMPEIVEQGVTGELVNTTGEGFFEPRLVNTAQIAANADTILRHREQYAIAARQAAEQRFSLDRMIDLYCTVIEAATPSHE